MGARGGSRRLCSTGRTCDKPLRVFCFITSAKGMLRSISRKDDDYRALFLYGNFTTLQPASRGDGTGAGPDRAAQPLFVSIHATTRTSGQPVEEPAGATRPPLAGAYCSKGGIEAPRPDRRCADRNNGKSCTTGLAGILAATAMATGGAACRSASPGSRPRGPAPHYPAEAAPPDVCDIC